MPSHRIDRRETMKFRLKPAGKRRGACGIAPRRLAPSSSSTATTGPSSSSLLPPSLLALLVLLLPASPTSALTELQILKRFANELSDELPWLITGTDPCDDTDYPGITCNSNGHVTDIDLSDYDMAGKVSQWIYALPHLKTLNLAKNRITDGGWSSIIDEILTDEDTILSEIEVIDLTRNMIGNVDGVDALKESLTELHLTYNNLRGTMPEELFLLDKLEKLAISENDIDGKVDTRIGRLTNLREFYCYGNKITGEIPTEIGELTKMQIITFAENKLSGPLPDEIKNMGNLKTFSVHNNDPNTGSHTGPVPAFDTHPHLNEIYLDGNAFTGEIPSTFLSSYNLTSSETVKIGLSNNQLTGPIPLSFLEYSSLNLDIVGNDITGLEDKFFKALCDRGALEIGGWMNGKVQDYGCDAILCPVGTYSESGRQEDNDTGCEVCPVGTGGRWGATECDSDEAPASSDLEILCEFYLALKGGKWDSKDGWSIFDGMESKVDLTLPTYQEQEINVCTFEGVGCNQGSVISLSLPNNGLGGLVPESLWDLAGLEVLDLSGNEVMLDRDSGFGKIGNAKKLYKVNLSSNDIYNFKGVGAATGLVELIVDDAYFWSELDTEVYQLENLKSLHIQFSGLKGKIPPGLDQLTKLRSINLNGNDLSGWIPTEFGVMTELWHIDLSDNDFYGDIPDGALRKLPNLQKFHVNQRSRKGTGLTGPIPSFKEQTKLHMLDLSSNQLTGTIPIEFLSGVVDTDQQMEIGLSRNNFVGTIPGTLSRFSSMRFHAIGNKFTGVDSALCSLRGWMGGEVGRVIDDGSSGCDAIICPKGMYSDMGRAKVGAGECLDCPDGEYAGQTSCGGKAIDPGMAGAFDDVDIGVGDSSLEQKILDKLYAVTGGGTSWKNDTDWPGTSSMCEYAGITCINNSVSEINLAGFGLINSIPTEIYQLPSLKIVDFSDSVVDLSFDGVERAANLEEIRMGDADLTDVTGVSNAPALKKLHIPRNSFPDFGPIPDELYSIATLENLAISNNGFGGSISADVKKLSNLKEFWAGSNEITGTIPEEMTQLSHLTSLVLSGNRMTGAIPNQFENIESLKQLHLNGQHDYGGFTGPLPNFKNAKHLGDIDFSKNSLTGSIPDDFLETLRQSTSHADYAYDVIKLSSNQITGALPASWDDFVGLFADLADNRITDVPNVLCDDDDEFMNNLVGELMTNKCDAILCPPGTHAPLGRVTDVYVGCELCDGRTLNDRKEQAPFYGSLNCKPISEERKILENLHDLIFTGDSTDTHWMSENPICSWFGITCDDQSADSGVTEIKLESNSLTTDSPEEVSKLFFDLPDLERLNIRGNDGLALTFDHVGKPPRLEMLQLSATGLTSISGIGKATKLKELHVTENDIEGAFPEELCGLTFLKSLYMSFNKISGTIPTEIGQLTDLREFYAYTNELTGELPTELGLLADMENLVIGQNSFEGTLPTELNNLANLEEFSVYYGGELTGPVLDFSKATNMEKLDLEGNLFTGQIPSNFLGGLDPNFAGEPDTEIVLHLADNILTGTLPETLLDIENLFIDVAGNQFKELPQSFCEQSNWMNGRVGELNNLCDAIACPQNTFSDSGREDCTPCGNFEMAPYIGSYSCSHVSKEFNALKRLYSLTNGDSWEENDGWMDYSVPICSWFGITCLGDSQDNNTVVGIDLPDNLLDGTVPPVVFEIPSLKTLNLKSNSIFIKFDTIDKADSLETLYISDVDIGSIAGIGKAPALKELHLTANELTGDIPEDFFELADTLERLYIAYNSLSGTLSTEFGKMTKLEDFYAYDNEFTGSIPSEIASIKSLTNFVVAENKLSGTIPEEFSSMPNLVLFSAYRRLKPGPKLSGPLPSFSNAPKLESLYLDYNHLAGTIPADFLKSSLNTNLVTISHNSLVGKVPVELALFDALNLEMEGNKITEVDDRFCDDDKKSWMNGLMADYGCDALMCQPGFHSIYGRQNSTDSACKKCAESSDPSPYWGSTTCDSVVDEKAVLTKFYHQTGGGKWRNNDNWLNTDDICSWYGVECREGSSVQALRLGANNLVGTPSEEIFRLHQLHTLWLHSNPIEFKFEGIQKAQNLVDLRLDSTGLSDVTGLGQAAALIRLDLKYNRISGKFPKDLLNLRKLEYLSLTDNRLTGGFPDGYYFSNMINLRLGSNFLSGDLNSFSDLKSILHLDLSDNDLEGPIPKNFLSLISARKPIEVDLSSNKLSGGVPVELARLDQLVIYLRDNSFTQLDPSLCNSDSDNGGWNLRGVEMFGCDGIMCPPGTANYHGRQSGENNPCLTCTSNTDLYGQITCDGLPLLASSSLRVAKGVVSTLITSIVAVIMLFM